MAKKENTKNRRLLYILAIFFVLILLIVSIFNIISDVKKRNYEGIKDSDGKSSYLVSDLDSGSFFQDEYNFRSYDDGVITSKRGIDVSEHQGEIDWEKVKNSGVEFVFIRAGYRSYDQGKIREDNRFKENIQGALENGIEVGIYFFSQAIDVDEAIEEATFAVNQAKSYNVTLPIVIDMEDVTGIFDRAYFLDKSEVTEIVDAFCTIVENYGYQSLIYGNPSWINRKLNLSQLTERNLWLAHYTQDTAFAYKYDVWQYSETGVIDGINEKVDLDIMFIKEELEEDLSPEE